MTSRSFGLSTPTRLAPVHLRLYDISNGKAALWSQVVLRHRIDGIWHTGIDVFGLEYFYGGGIDCMPADQVESSFRMTIVETRLLGHTTRTRAEFEQFLVQIYKRFTPETYDLLQWNCNHFSDTCARYLLGDRGIPRHILDLPNIVSSTFLGSLLLKIFHRFTQGWNPVLFSPDHPRHPCHHHDALTQTSEKNAAASGAPAHATPRAMRHAKAVTRTPPATTTPALAAPPACIPLPLNTPRLATLSPRVSPLTTRTPCTSSSDRVRDVRYPADARAVLCTFGNNQQQQPGPSATTSGSHCQPAPYADGHHSRRAGRPDTLHALLVQNGGAPRDTARNMPNAGGPFAAPPPAARPAFWDCAQEHHDGVNTPMTSRATSRPGRRSIGALEGRRDLQHHAVQQLLPKRAAAGEGRAGDADGGTESPYCTVGRFEPRQQNYQQRPARFADSCCCDRPSQIEASRQLATPEPPEELSVAGRVPNLLYSSRFLFKTPAAEPWTPRLQESHPATRTKTPTPLSSQHVQQRPRKTSVASLAPLAGMATPSASAPHQVCLETGGVCSQNSSRVVSHLRFAQPSEEVNAQPNTGIQKVPRLTFAEVPTLAVTNDGAAGPCDGGGLRIAQSGRGDVTTRTEMTLEQTWRQPIPRRSARAPVQPPSQPLSQPPSQPLSQPPSQPLSQPPSQPRSLLRSLPPSQPLPQPLIRERIDHGTQTIKNVYPVSFHHVKREKPKYVVVSTQQLPEAQERCVPPSDATLFQNVTTTAVTVASAADSTLFPRSCAQKASPAIETVTRYDPTKRTFQILATPPCPKCGTRTPTHRQALCLRCDCFPVSAVTAR